MSGVVLIGWITSGAILDFRIASPANLYIII